MFILGRRFDWRLVALAYIALLVAVYCLGFYQHASKPLPVAMPSSPPSLLQSAPGAVTI